MKISKIILIILLFVAFFEIGIFSSYTIVTSEVPDIQELIDMQVNTITSIFSPENVGSVLIKSPDELNVTNKYELADAISDAAEVDGVSLDNMTVTTNADINEESNFTVNVTAYGYSSPKSNSTSIIISGEPNYKIIASAQAKYTVNGLEVDTDTVKVDSILKIYDEENSTSSSNSSYDSGPSGSTNTTYNYSSSSDSDYDSGASEYSSSSSSSSYSDSGDSNEISIGILNPVFISLFN